MLPEARWSVLDGVSARQIRCRSAAACRGGRRRRSAIRCSVSGVEYRRWANAMLQDHELLRRLLDRVDRAKDPKGKASLFHLAVEFHEAHQRFEHVWDPAPELAPDRLDLDQVTELLVHLVPNTPAWNAMTRAWSARLRTLMGSEDLLHSDRPEREASIASWPSDLLECRLSLISEVRDVLQA